MSEIDVPFVKQKEKYFCSEASAEMILNYYGHDTSPLFQYHLDSLGCNSMENMHRCLSPFLKCKLEKGSCDKLKTNLDEEIPTMLRVIPKGQKERHTVVLTGLDEKGIVVNDPKTGRTVFDKEFFTDLWSKTDNLMLTCQPY